MGKSNQKARFGNLPGFLVTMELSIWLTVFRRFTKPAMLLFGKKSPRELQVDAIATLSHRCCSSNKTSWIVAVSFPLMKLLIKQPNGNWKSSAISLSWCSHRVWLNLSSGLQHYTCLQVVIDRKSKQRLLSARVRFSFPSEI